MSDVWEVRLNGACYGHFEGLDAEKKANSCFQMRTDARPKNVYTFELYKNSTKVATESSKVKSSGAAAALAAAKK